MCPLCHACTITGHACNSIRSFLRCSTCGLVFVPSDQHLSVQDEKRRYDLHTNTIDDTGYVAYLEGVADAVAGLGVRDPSVLDFGCGKHAVLARILAGKGVRCESYDPLYGMGADCLGRRYDVVVVCEVVEHVRDLRSELGVIRSMVRSGGYVLIKTLLVPEDAPFAGWWYAQDLTHVNFFSERSLCFVAGAVGGALKRVKSSDTFLVGPCGWKRE